MQSLDFVLDEAGDAAVRRLWRLLQDVGLPSRGDHRGASNRPHITLCSAPELPATCVTYAERLARALPLRLPVPGVRTFDRSNLVYVAVAVPDLWQQRVQQLRQLARDDSAWTPHITVSGRLTDDQVRAARQLMIGVPTALMVTAVTHWDPATGHVRML
ncbi:2'-5' RNA ligase superfamily protein [Branchiibius hedensis]|uniref:2'-5' RNA ligase superfamily protein n=1 Tax=Branchiibius hedensis TaxID=672460 RepID=A0A2Y8ZW02_9MICO|nr:2'-5' RNA ligase family protein [Branchiibius hedensis]PWJ27454.1 2'-5' RNA ligase superfamily protein [Branchiibius hedensis]SSA36264.1 2'-5' RNA ligase superfamily protein [Branchiibius hedensis]